MEAENGHKKFPEMETDEKSAAKLLPVTKYRGWKAMPYVIGNETFEKLGTIGTSSNLLVYLTTVFHLKSVNAVTLLNIVNGTTNMAPVLGAFISDAFLGRFWTLGLASVSSFTGMLILTFTAAFSKLHPPPCPSGHSSCIEPSNGQMAVLIAAFAFLAIGAGGIRPCNLAFGADQFNPKTESGRRGINSFFNWYYFTFTFAMMISSTLIIYVQSNVNWAIGLGIPTILMFFSVTLFYLGSPIYVKVKPEGSPFTSIAQVLAAAFRKRGLDLPDDGRSSLFDPPHLSSLNSKLPHTDQFRFLDKAAILTQDDVILSANGLPKNPWRLCSLQQVEEVKCVLRIIPVWSTAVVYYIGSNQQSTYVTYEALQSNRQLGKFLIPAASFSVFTMAAMTIWIPIYDRLIVPWFQRRTKKEGGISLLQRMGVGLVIAIVAIIVSALVEQRRRNYALHRPTLGLAPSGGAISSMSSLWLIPQLILFGLAEAFNAVGQIEFYYKQFPENMRSVAGSLLFLGMSVSNYLSGLMVTVVHKTTGKNGGKNWLAADLNKAKLDTFYFLIAIIMVLNLVYFMVCAKWYKYKGSEGVNPEIELEESKTKNPPV